jgi:hypothetical protein
MRMIVFLAALLASAGPCEAAAAAAAKPTMAVQQAQEPISEAIQADLTAYGVWLNRSVTADEGLRSGLMRFADQWQTTFSRPLTPASLAEMRRTVAALIVEADRAQAALDAVPLPNLTALQLDQDLLPSAMMRDFRAVNRQIRALVESYNTILDAVERRDVRAANRAVGASIGAMRLLYQNQAAIARAGLALTPREESTWNMGNVGLHFFQAGARVLAAWPADGGPGTDRALAADLRGFAAALETTAAEGERRMIAEEEAIRADIAEAERARDAGLVSILRTGRRVAAIDRDIFVQGRRLAAVLRTGAARFDAGRISAEALSAFFEEIVPIKVRLDEIAAEESAALAAGN